MTQTVTETRQAAPTVEPGARLTPELRPPSRRMPTAPLLVAAGGLLVAAIAATTLVTSLVAPRSEPVQPSVPARQPFPDVGVTDGTYEPGHSSGWHVHPGLHSVVVLDGTLTIYDEACERRQFRPGDTYLGGDHPHVARNEGPEPLRFAVTYVFRQASEVGPGHGAPAPACATALR